MKNELCWDTFAKSGSVSDYLKYAQSSEHCASNAVKEEREQRERKSDGDGTLCRNHW